TKEEKGEESESAKLRIDFDGISQRIVALPLPPANFSGLSAGKEGEVFLLQACAENRPVGGGPVTLRKFKLADRKSVPLASGIEDFRLSANGEKFLYRQGPKWGLGSTAAPIKPGDGMLNMNELQVLVHPREEWNQMYHEVWHIERDYLYASNYHGL